VADNRAAALSRSDPAVLKAYANRQPDLTRGWTEEEWAAIVSAHPRTPRDGHTDPDAVPDLTRRISGSVMRSHSEPITSCAATLRIRKCAV
jgi:hypothetical protein